MMTTPSEQSAGVFLAYLKRFLVFSTPPIDILLKMCYTLFNKTQRRFRMHIMHIRGPDFRLLTEPSDSISITPAAG
jgi:hypothetical protein